MLNEKVSELLNDQINKEMYSAYLYLDFANFYTNNKKSIMKKEAEGKEMLNEKVSELLNDQINKEMYSAYLYLDFANFYTAKGLDGFANWYRIQAKEEMDHAIGIINYLQDNDYVVTLDTIDKPDKECDIRYYR